MIILRCNGERLERGIVRERCDSAQRLTAFFRRMKKFDHPASVLCSENQISTN